MDELNKNSSIFWKNYSKRKDLSPSSLMNLETDKRISENKFSFEISRFQEKVTLKPNWEVVDLGGGIGNWSNFFAKQVKKVHLVEREKSFLELAANNCNAKNIKFINMDALDYKASNNSIDLIFCSGLTIYLNDKSLSKLISNTKKYLKNGALFVHRDAYGVNGEFNVNKYSEKLSSNYAAMYRSKEQYKYFFENKYNFELISEIDMYPQNSEFNKWSETRLRMAIYKNVK
jgi:ubiquinone/menaquinone biosynthesis C-methylase UbiE